jgi:hypothetical protein
MLRDICPDLRRPYRIRTTQPALQFSSVATANLACGAERCNTKASPVPEYVSVYAHNEWYIAAQS